MLSQNTGQYNLREAQFILVYSSRAYSPSWQDKDGGKKEVFGRLSCILSRKLGKKSAGPQLAFCFLCRPGPQLMDQYCEQWDSAAHDGTVLAIKTLI